MHALITSTVAGLRSVKTTILGVVILVSGVTTVARALLTGEASDIDWNVVITDIVAGSALIFARDADVSSEQSRAK